MIYTLIDNNILFARLLRKIIVFAIHLQTFFMPWQLFTPPDVPVMLV